MPLAAYRDLLKRIRPLGFDEVGRFKTEGLELATIASQYEPKVIPFAFPNRPIILENGDDSEIDSEVEGALLRWIANQPRHG